MGLNMFYNATVTKEVAIMKTIMNYLIKEKKDISRQTLLIIKALLMVILAFAFKPVAGAIGYELTIAMVAVMGTVIFLFGERYSED